MNTIGVTGLGLVCFSVGAIIAALILTRSSSGTYQDPALHPGEEWNLSVVAQDRVTWTRPVLRDYGGGKHVHVIKTCSIGPGMAHVDTCWCKAERYGVYGAWS